MVSSSITCNLHKSTVSREYVRVRCIYRFQRQCLLPIVHRQRQMCFVQRVFSRNGIFSSDRRKLYRLAEKRMNSRCLGMGGICVAGYVSGILLRYIRYSFQERRHLRNRSSRKRFPRFMCRRAGLAVSVEDTGAEC